ncbi:hypothetical protein ACFYYY_00165 [Streptomyces sp. NPDC001834]|uniref:hypothetical protein n=1 Tax=Streptomyces sp. NPDC001834 TaxID=3364616 RepID=UPI00367A6623
MDAIQQQMLDSHRALARGEKPPPLPARHDWEVLREVRDRQRFEAVTAGRPARARSVRAVRGRRWTALRALRALSARRRARPVR